MTALFDTWLLVLDVNTTCTCIDEHLNEFHNRCDTTETSISVGNAGHEEINFLSLFSLIRS
jgi:4-hydroxy-3-methylbut-2-enyl diphosphate reductase IspH